MIGPNITRRPAGAIATTIALALVLAGPRTAAAQAKACVRTATGAFVPNGIVASGVTLGSCMANAAWGRVVPLNMTAGAATANALATGTVSFTYVAGSLYLGFTVAQDADLNVFDAVVVAVDRTGNGWDDDDFFLRVRPDTAGWGAGNPRVSPGGGTACNGNTIVEYYRYSSSDGGFVLDNAAVGQITAKVAYDYETTTDVETNLWNLEIRVPTGAVALGGHSYFGIATAAFAMGAYVFADLGANQSGQTGMVLRWPDGIGDRQISQWDLNAPALNAATLAQMSVNDVCFNVTFAGVASPWEINGGMASDGNHLVNPVSQTNTFRVSYLYDGPGDAPTAGTNSGTVTLELIPSISTNWTPTTAWVQSHNVTLSTYNQIYSEVFTAPPNSFRADAVFLCAKPRLENFARDDYVVMCPSCGENQLHINHNYFHTSVDTQVVDLRAEGIPGLSPGASTRILLYVNSTNDPSGRLLGLADGSPRGGAPSGRLFLGFAVVCLGGAAAARRRPGVRAVLGLVAVALVVHGCKSVQPGPTIGTDRWQLINAKELGITPLPNETGWYQVPITQGQVKRMQIVFGDRPLPYQTATQRLAMALDSATGRPRTTTIPVRAGQIVTVLAFGDVDPDGPDGPLPASSASGTKRQATTRPTATLAAVAPRYFLNNPRYIPSQWVGTLIGSFDGFKTSFVVGTDASLAVPRGAEQLSLAVNGVPTDYRQATGAFTIKTIVTGGPTVPTTVPVGFDTPFDSPRRLDSWRVLTATHVYSFYEKPVVNPQTQQQVMARVQLGQVHMSIYESGAR
jgi:hypothetical protein